MSRNIKRSERNKRVVYASCLLGALIGILGGLLGPLSLLLTLAGIGVVMMAVILLRDLLKQGKPEMDKVECDCFRPSVRLRAFPRSAYTLREYHSKNRVRTKSHQRGGTGLSHKEEEKEVVK